MKKILNSENDISEVVYTKLISLYPKEYRKEYGELQKELFKMEYKESKSKLGFWMFILKDLFSTIPKEYIGISTNFNLYTIMGNRIKFNTSSIISSIFILISVLVVSILTLLQYAFNSSLIQPFSLRIGVIIFLVVVLPFLSIIFSTISLINALKAGWSTMILKDFVKFNAFNLIIFAISIVLFLGYLELLFFHDSNHCVVYLNHGLKAVRECIVNS